MPSFSAPPRRSAGGAGALRDWAASARTFSGPGDEPWRDGRADGQPAADPALRRGRMKRTRGRSRCKMPAMPLYDVQWEPAIVDRKARRKPRRAAVVRVGLRDGRTMPLVMTGGADPSKLRLNDVIYVKRRRTETRTRDGRCTRRRRAARAAARARGGLVLENRTGRILSMVGSFSYVQSQLNRTTQARRQPGSSIKPVVYLAALQQGLQPNTLVRDTSVTLPPIPGVTAHSWTPRNYDRSSAGTMTLRRALEQSATSSPRACSTAPSTAIRAAA